jgi:hypothetical protein
MLLYRNITRIDNATNRTHAWVVIVQRKGETARRYFSDTIHGGRQEALAAAIVHRDILLSCHSQFEYYLWFSSRLRKNNTSGIPGVGRYERPIASNNRRGSAYWIAAWTDEHGKSHARKFSVSIHGERRAKHLAIAERERQLLRVSALKKNIWPNIANPDGFTAS